MSKLNLNNKLLIYIFVVVIKPIWTYGIQLWGAAFTSNIEILERFQSKALRLITDASWYVPNAIIRRDLQVTSVKEKNSSPQRPVQRWTLHPFQPPTNTTLKAICFQKTEETHAIRSTPQIYCINM
jgi:hypothetical protein